MKFKLLNDLHLEFGDFEVPKTLEDKDTILLLAGDIHVGVAGMDFVTKMCDQFKYVYMVAGNHEFYNHNLWDVTAAWKKFEVPNANFVFLDNDIDYFVEGDKTVAILGGTLWTDMGQDEEDAWFIKQHIQHGMNDFRIIKTQNEDTGDENCFTVYDAAHEHDKTVEFLDAALKQANEKEVDAIIVMTHHLPTFKVVAQKWKTPLNQKMNHAFATDLDWLIEKHKPTVWVCGHTHDSIVKDVGDTLILCNPRGYFPFALNPIFNENMIFELEEDKPEKIVLKNL